jgi:hypothetical protein
MHPLKSRNSRILWLRLAVEVLRGRGIKTELLGFIKATLQAKGAQAEWRMEPVLDHLRSQVSRADHELLSSLVAALSFPGNLDALDSFPEWRMTEPKSL